MKIMKIIKNILSFIIIVFISNESLASIGDTYNCKQTNSVRLRDHIFTEYELNSFSFTWTEDKIILHSKGFLEDAIYLINKDFSEKEFFTAEGNGSSILSYEKGNFYFVQSGFYYAYAISAKCIKNRL